MSAAWVASCAPGSGFNEAGARMLRKWLHLVGEQDIYGHRFNEAGARMLRKCFLRLNSWRRR